jgi:hypothetical protein
MAKLQSPSPAGNSTSGPTALLTARELLFLRYGCPTAQDSFEHPRHQPMVLVFLEASRFVKNPDHFFSLKIDLAR